jgi:hypothetical protein
MTITTEIEGSSNNLESLFALVARAEIARERGIILTDRQIQRSVSASAEIESHNLPEASRRELQRAGRIKATDELAFAEMRADASRERFAGV